VAVRARVYDWWDDEHFESIQLFDCDNGDFWQSYDLLFTDSGEEVFSKFDISPNSNQIVIVASLDSDYDVGVICIANVY